MSFEPFTPKYTFDKTTLIKHFPDYLLDPIATWIHSCLRRSRLLRDATSRLRSVEILDTNFRQTMQLHFHRPFSREVDTFLDEICGETELVCELMAYLLQEHCRPQEARALERILRMGSSAYTVIWLKENVQSYEEGVFNLGWQVPDVVAKQAEEALMSEQLLRDAWHDCYKRNADPSACVSKCADFMEGFLRDKFNPGETRTPPLIRYTEKFQKNPELFIFKGSTFLEDKTRLLSLLEGVSHIRGEHTTGQGRPATSDEAIFILNTTIYIWNLMR